MFRLQDMQSGTRGELHGIGGQDYKIINAPKVAFFFFFAVQVANKHLL